MASAHVREELVARLVGDGDVAALELAHDVPVDVPLQEVDDEFYAAANASTSAAAASPAPLTAPVPEERVLRWQKGTYLGSGSFGDAYLALNLETGEHYVVKQIRLDADHPESIPDVRITHCPRGRLVADCSV